MRDDAAVDLAPALLPDDVEALRAIVLAQHAEIAGQRERIARLRLQLARLRRMQFGHPSERAAREADQLELALEDLEADAPAPPGADEDAADAGAEEAHRERRKPARRPLPAHLPRETVEHGADTCACPACGGVLRRLGEEATEVLDYVPGRFRVIRHVRPRWSCRACDRITGAPAPSPPISRGRATAGLLAHVLVAKYADHLPLYRQSGIYARAGVELDRSTLADRVGQSAALLRPLVGALARHVMGGGVLHADDTPVPVLAPGAGRTRTGRLWAYLRDERPHASAAPPAVLYRYSPDRKAEHPRAHLRDFRGVLQADGYGGFEGLYGGGRVVEAAPAGPTSDAGSTTSTPPARHRSPPRRSAASDSSTPSRRRSAASRPTSVRASVRRGRRRCWKGCALGSPRPSAGSPAGATSRAPSATPSRAGRR